MKLLYIAYSCRPDRGSEDRIGWMLPLTMAQNHEVFVITKPDHRREIEDYCNSHPGITVRFYYAEMPRWARRTFRGLTYSLRLNLWHRAALPLAAELCRREGITLIHQITPVEFRSIGDYGAIPGVTYLCGPVGGGEYIPRPLWRYAGSRLPVELARWAMNGFARWRLHHRGILGRCDGLLFANPETRHWLKPVLPEGLSLGICPEVGMDVQHICPKTVCGEGCTFLAASRLIRRKGYDLLLDALAALSGEMAWRLVIAGTGPEENRLKKKARRLGLGSRVTFAGRVPFSEMEALYAAADVLVMPSLRETTGSVVTEAMARGLPVVTQGRFGAAALITEETGWRCDTLHGLQAALLECVRNPAEVRRRGRNAAAAAAAHTWDVKADDYRSLYEKLQKGEGKHDRISCGASL